MWAQPDGAIEMGVWKNGAGVLVIDACQKEDERQDYIARSTDVDTGAGVVGSFAIRL
jgi:hypothetical protein